MDGKQLSFQYKECISDYREWKQQAHAREYVLYKENLGEYLSIDETCLSNGELYTILTNKAARGGKGALVAMVEGTKAEVVIHSLCKMPRGKRLKVKEVTLDLSPSIYANECVDILGCHQSCYIMGNAVILRLSGTKP